MIRLALTFAALVVLAAASWILSALGAPTVVALVIAGVKAVLIGLVFMELSHAHAVPRTIVVVAVLFIALLVAGTLTDVDLRS
jgi:caa(3)-type oxidase subunit IV